LPTSLNKGAAIEYCSFSQTVSTTTFGSLADFTVGVTASTTASGLPNGSTNGTAVVRVIPRPKLAVNVWASPYRLGGTGNGLAGVASYPTGNLSMAIDPAAAEPTVRTPTGWLYFTVRNQGGAGSNLSLGLTRNGSSVSLASCGTLPTSLADSGTTGDTFTCILPISFSATGVNNFAGTATATNSMLVGGTQPTVTVSLASCSTGQRVIPDLVDTLNPTADGTTQTVSQSKNAWQNAGFNNSNYATTPAGASGSAKVTTQDKTAYTCQSASGNVTVTAP
jgi:hypothetical protein